MALAEEVLIPDFAPPHTVCLNMLSKSPHVMKKQRFIGPVVSAKYETSQPEPAGIAKFKSDNIPKNTTVVGFCEDPSPYIAAAELVIAQAGHSTAMEILTLGKPALIIPIKGHAEQEYNANRMKEFGMCETLDYESFNSEDLYEKIKLLLNENGFKEKAKLFSENAREMKGSQKAADIILELSNRIQCY